MEENGAEINEPVTDRWLAEDKPLEILETKTGTNLGRIRCSAGREGERASHRF